MTIPCKALLVALAVVALVTGWPLWANASFYFVDPTVQILDFASYDMLVVEAKKLSLLHGHYSRAGFYHPGPFYFYWMAGWEALLHDHLPLFSSAAAVQHFAATLLMALAFGSFAHLTTRLSGDTATGFAATAALFALVYLAAGNVITAPWPPNMLVASSIFTVTACTGLLLHGWGWLPLFCFGALQLLHGHASFFGLLPVMLLPSLLLAWQWHGLPRNPLHSPAVWLALAITSVMLAPLAVITLFNFPEPWASYLQQAGLQSGQQTGTGAHLDLTTAALLLGGFLLPSLAGLPLIIATRLPNVRHRSTAQTPTTTLVAVVIFASGLVAAAWFALRGVDSIDNRYLLFWFAPYAALPGALAVVVLANRLHRIASVLLCVVVIAATIMTCRHMLPWMLFNDKQYRQYQQVWQRLQLLGQNAPVHIHTDNRARYGDIWSQVLTFASLSHRADKPVLCVAASSWHLSYHAALRCDDRGSTDSVKVLVSTEPAVDAADRIGEINGIYFRTIEERP